MSDVRPQLRIAIPDVPAARALAHVWASGVGPVGDVYTSPIEEAEAMLRAGTVDLAFVPALSVLRDPDAYSVIPGVALVGRAYPSSQLHLPAGLAALAARRSPQLGLDPRYTQDALLTQVVLKEGYGVVPQFVPVAPGASVADLDGYVLPAEAAAPDHGVTLDLGKEWFELTTRPMVWALLVSTAGGVEPDEAGFLRDRAAELEEEPPEPSIEEPASITLAAYAHAGLDAWIHHLFYHRAIEDLPEIPFVLIEVDAEEDPAEDEE